MESKTKSFLIIAAVLAFVIGWSTFVYMVGAETIVESIGVENTYIVAFLIAACGGVSTLTATSFYTTIATLAAGGSNPLFLALAAGIGVTIGDSIFYYIGLRSHYASKSLIDRWTQKLRRFIDRRPRYFAPVFTFLYAGFTPLPNDILGLGLGFSNTRYLLILPPLLAGNILMSYWIIIFSAKTVEAVS